MNSNQAAREIYRVLFEYGPLVHTTACKVMDIHTRPPEFRLKTERKYDFFVENDNIIVINSSTVYEILEQLQKLYSRYNPTLKDLVVYSLEEEIPHYIHFVQNPDIRGQEITLQKKMVVDFLSGNIERGKESYRRFVLQHCYVEGVGKKARCLIEDEIKYPGKHFDIIFGNRTLNVAKSTWERIRKVVELTDDSYRREIFDQTLHIIQETMGRQLTTKWSQEDMRRFARQWEYEFTPEDYEMLDKTIHTLFTDFDRVFPWLLRGYLATVIRPKRLI